MANSEPIALWLKNRYKKIEELNRIKLFRLDLEAIFSNKDFLINPDSDDSINYAHFAVYMLLDQYNAYPQSLYMFYVATYYNETVTSDYIPDPYRLRFAYGGKVFKKHDGKSIISRIIFDFDTYLNASEMQNIMDIENKVYKKYFPKNILNPGSIKYSSFDSDIYIKNARGLNSVDIANRLKGNRWDSNVRTRLSNIKSKRRFLASDHELKRIDTEKIESMQSETVKRLE